LHRSFKGDQLTHETAFTMDASSIKFGPGTTGEVGYDLHALGVKRALVVTDPNLAKSVAVEIALKSLREAGVEAVLYDRVRVEPTDASFLDAIEFATEGNFDGYVAVGGGSVIDTAKAANLYATYPADLLAYVNAPIGRAEPVPGKLKPLIAIPTTAGTGSETTGVAIFDYEALHAKTGIAHRALRPVLGIIDPNNTRTMPRMVAACSALDVLSHAIESYTAISFSDRPAPESPKMRPAYQGSNPISDVWAARAIELLTANLEAVLDDPNNDNARGQMMLAAAFAGVGFGNAGVHLPHGMSYPVSGMVRDYVPEGYNPDHPIIPHGMSVILNAPAVFRFTASANPARHLEAAKLLGADITGASPDDAGEILSGAIVRIMKQTGMPNGLKAVGFTENDIPELVKGTLPQHRVTKLSPRPASEIDLAAIFQDSMTIWN
jgi:hydroxyacid-oxoacid transhydrogenase